MIAILGTGPAGLMAAHACAIAGRPFVLFGMPNKHGNAEPSKISGAQFIHVPVPELVKEEEPDFVLTYEVRGDAENYATKVYGPPDELIRKWVPFVSFSNVQDGQEVPAWSMQAIYERLWQTIAGDGKSVTPMEVTAKTVEEWLESQWFDLIVSTIPRPAICRAHAGLDNLTHNFLSQTVHIHQGDYANAPDNTIIYNGDPWPSWYRASTINGIGSVEWGRAEQVHPAFKNKVTPVKKPVVHGCECWEGRPVRFAGRYGKWQKGVLAHDGFTTTIGAFMERGWL